MESGPSTWWGNASTRWRDVTRYWVEIVVVVLVVALLAFVAYLAASSSNCGPHGTDPVATASNPDCASVAPIP
jgi:hypothetical protein